MLPDAPGKSGIRHTLLRFSYNRKVMLSVMYVILWSLSHDAQGKGPYQKALHAPIPQAPAHPVSDGFWDRNGLNIPQVAILCYLR